VVKLTEKRLITAALPYVNNIPHLGHIVGSHLPADIFARYCRSKGYDTLFIGGTDENGTPALLAAEEHNIPLPKFLDTIYEVHKKIYEWFNISYDNFSRTSKKIHAETTQAFFKTVEKNGFVTQGSVKQFYDEEKELFLADRYVTGTCGYCNYEHARGDQCEECGNVLDTTTLKNPVSTISKKTPIIKESNHLFLDYPKLSPKLQTWIESQTHWRHQVRNLALGWLKEGLKERSITRDLKSGIPVPLEGFEDKVFYVWFDAPIGYISSTKEHTPKWKDYWQNKDSQIYHFVGKDNIPFHSIFWPASLIAQGEYNLPYNVVGLQYLTFEGGKFSKTHKRGVFCEHLEKAKIPVDILRAYLTFLIPESDDTEFKWDELGTRVNADIIGNVGNFINRTLTYAANKCESTILQPTKLNEADTTFVAAVKKQVDVIEQAFEAVELRQALREVLKLSDIGNKYFNDQQPWVVIKEDKQRAQEIVYQCSNVCKTLAIVIAPFLPETAEKINKQLNITTACTWEELQNPLPKKHTIGTPKVLFEKITPEHIEQWKKITAETSPVSSFF